MLIVDVNEFWYSEGLVVCCQLLVDFGVVMFEQLFFVDDDLVLENFVYLLLICVDESCYIWESLLWLCGCYEMINIKLDKMGGLIEVLVLVGEVEWQEFEWMLGCMFCILCGIVVVFFLVLLVCFVDFDGLIWLVVDVELVLWFSIGVFYF